MDTKKITIYEYCVFYYFHLLIKKFNFLSKYVENLKFHPKQNIYNFKTKKEIIQRDLFLIYINPQTNKKRRAFYPVLFKYMIYLNVS